MPRYPFSVCDVFTDRALAGNQLAVFPAASGVPEELMGPLAREINFSETVFGVPPAGDGDVGVRIFTPAGELPFAGHPILGAAAALGGGRERVVVETGAGSVPVRLDPRGERRWEATMVQPVPMVAPYAGAAEVLAALGVSSSVLPVEVYDNGIRHVFVTLGTPDEVAALRPDMAALTAACPDAGVNCIAGGETRWVTRMFWPAQGVAEDPATGSAAGPLGVHACRHGRAAYGTPLVVSQGSAVGRPSTLRVIVAGGARAVSSVEVAGGVVLVAEGRFLL